MIKHCNRKVLILLFELLQVDFEYNFLYMIKLRLCLFRVNLLESLGMKLRNDSNVMIKHCNRKELILLSELFQVNFKYNFLYMIRFRLCLFGMNLLESLGMKLRNDSKCIHFLAQNNV